MRHDAIVRQRWELASVHLQPVSAQQISEAAHLCLSMAIDQSK